jgi:hypothetical protein
LTDKTSPLIPTFSPKGEKEQRGNMPEQALDRKEARKIRKDIKVLAGLTEIYCREKHRHAEMSPIHPTGLLTEYALVLNVRLCDECRKLVLHGAVMRIKCPMDPKPECKACPDHCYQPKYREQVREVMRFAWRHMLKRGRIDLVIKHM